MLGPKLVWKKENGLILLLAAVAVYLLFTWNNSSFGQRHSASLEKYEVKGISGETLRSVSKVSFVLIETFNHADVNNDSLLSKDEVVNWISSKIKLHLDEALGSNFALFNLIDRNPKNGIVTWKEYCEYFLKENGIKRAIIDYNRIHKGLPRNLKEDIMRDKAYWSEAAKTNPNHLDINEFLAFRHPESSHANILDIIDAVLFNLDDNGDSKISLQEFLKGDPDISDQSIEEKKLEFASLDKDLDGFLVKMELIVYINPRNPQHANEEMKLLFSVADENNDDLLTIEEMLKEPQLFLESKMVDAAKSFHDEF